MPRFNLDEYVDVQERINRFWSENANGRIATELMSLPDEFERVVFKAEVYKDRASIGPDATGWAAEVAGGGGANQTSWHENAETSAIGRALANMGYAKTRDDRPSKQEMAKVNRAPQSARPEPRAESPPRLEDVTPTMAGQGQVKAIVSLWERLGRDRSKLGPYLFEQFAQNDPLALTQDQAGTVIGQLDEEARLLQRAKLT